MAPADAQIRARIGPKVRHARATGPDIISAGALVLRRGESGGREVLVVHRPKYDDWAFPKGKQEPGEHITATAVREVAEETGRLVRLGRPLPPQLYAVAGGRAKMVRYWVARVRERTEPRWRPTAEVDEVRWVPVEQTGDLLTYLDDLELLDRVHGRLARRTVPLVVLRHARARSRKRWPGEDPERPLTRTGTAQAEALAPLLDAFGVRRVVTSASRRCVQTVTPFAALTGRDATPCDDLTEEDWSEPGVADLLDAIVAGRAPTVLCTHRPVLPAVFDHLGLAEEPLSPAEVVVVHLRKGAVAATERHRVD